jgi:ABC-type multidrug transport system fused ATPase/permease subunit
MKSGIVRSLIASVVTSLPSIVLALLVLSSSRSPAEIFPAIASLNSLRLPLLFLPGALNSIFVDSRVAAQRYNKEVNALSSRPAVTPTPANGEIRLDNVTSSFFRTPLDLSIAGGTVTAVVGAVGSGKSTFLSLVSALSPLSSGTLSAPPHLHRVPQSKWLPTFSFLPSLVTHPLPFDSALYSRVLAATSLDGDNAPLSLSSPSGGQASRLCVARALYAACVEGGFLLLDDVLGSLDPETRKAVWAGVLEMQAAYVASASARRTLTTPTPHPH